MTHHQSLTASCSRGGLDSDGRAAPGAKPLDSHGVPARIASTTHHRRASTIPPHHATRASSQARPRTGAAWRVSLSDLHQRHGLGSAHSSMRLPGKAFSSSSLPSEASETWTMYREISYHTHRRCGRLSILSRNHHLLGTWSRNHHHCGPRSPSWMNETSELAGSRMRMGQGSRCRDPIR